MVLWTSSETWLLPNIFDEELFDSRYNVYRNDRDYALLGVSKGGGTLIAVRRSLCVDMLYSRMPLSLPGADVTFISIAIGQGSRKHKLWIFCCYFPQNQQQCESEATFFEFLSDLTLNNPFDKYIVVGDFNIGDIVWSHKSDNTFAIQNPSENNLIVQLFAFICFSGWGQHNGIFNSNNRLLDLVLSNVSCSVERTTPLSLPEDAHHPSFSVLTDIMSIESNLCYAPRIVRRFQVADYNALNNELNNIDWLKQFETCDIINAVDKFYSIVNSVVDRFVPAKTVYDTKKYPVWFNKSLIKLIKKKLLVHKRWKIYGRSSDYDKFSDLRHRTKWMEIECYNVFIARAEDNIHHSSRNFWSFVKSKRGSNNIPDTMFLGNTIGSDGSSISNLFSHFFQSVFEEDDGKIAEDDILNKYDSQPLIGTFNISRCTVESYLSKLDSSKGSGPDGLHPTFLKQCNHPQFSAPRQRVVLLASGQRGNDHHHTIYNADPFSPRNCIEFRFTKYLIHVISRFIAVLGLPPANNLVRAAVRAAVGTLAPYRFTA
ncbi:uncharacterized protein LOC113402523 [Vanessa tameamea]|uniref:Uncharacterized protein LOC113402523 n=1 Tax=Vanessa tameamea TaxID=334116 RepID=A0ABM4AZC4_VANTA